MRLLLRCDAGPATGVGHAVRCAALAEVAELSGHELFWSGRLDGLDWLWAGLSRTGWFAYTPLPGVGVTDRPGTLLPPADSADDLVALCVEHRIDAVHVDHYLLGDLRGPLNAAGVVLSTVEDFATGRRAGDVVVDPNLGAAERPRPDDGSPVLLRGPRYAPLRASVRRARASRPPHPSPARRTGRDGCGTPERGAPPRVLVVMGGTDAAGLLPAVTRTIAAAGAPADVDVVVPAGRTVDLPTGFRAVAPLPDLPGAAADVDLVVSAAGTTVWELCCVGVPMALVRAADNQLDGYRAVVAAGAAAGLGGPGDLNSPAAVATMRRLLTDPGRRAELAARARDVVDGHGAERIVLAISRAVGDRHDVRGGSTGAPEPRIPAITTRPATEDDAALLLEWRNDPETRRWSRSPDPVTAAEHLAWLRRSLDDGQRLLVVAEDDDGPVGTVRWDHDTPGWEVSITVAPGRRGAGLAGPLLAAGEQVLRDRTGGRVPAIAVVHRDNAASLRLFERAGYRPDGPPDDAGFVSHRKTPV